MDETTTYLINNIEFTVKRSFRNEKTVKDLIMEILTRDKEPHTFELKNHA